MKYILFLLTSFFYFNHFSQNTTHQQNVVSTWKKYDTITKSDQLITALLKHKKKSKAWTKRDELEFSKRLGQHYLILGKLDSALIFINEAIGFSNQFKEDSTLAYMYKLKGNTYYYLSDRIEAIKNYQRSIEIASRKKFLLLISQVQSNLGAMYIEEKEHVKAERTLLSSIRTAESLGQALSRPNLLATRLLATNYFDTKNYQKARPIFEDLIKKCRALNDTVVLVSSLVYYANYLCETKQIPKSLVVIDEALQIQNKLNDTQGKIATLMFYAKLLREKKSYKEALEKTDQAYLLKDDLFREQMAKSASEAEVKYQTNFIEKEKKIIELENQRNKQALSISENKRAKMWLYIAALILITSVAFLIYFIFQQKLKTKFEKNKSRELISALIKGEEQERSRIAKDLHDGIVQDLTVLKLSLQQHASAENGQLQDDLDKTIRQVRDLSYQMMPLALREAGLIPALEDMFHKILSRSGINYDFETFHLSFRLPENIETSLFRMAQELTNNVVKHARASQVTALLRFQNNNIHFLFEDNGIGFEYTSVKKGIGLTGLLNRVELVNGNLQVESTSGNGTTVSIRIPFDRNEG